MLLIEGGIYKDQRGIVKFVNDFNFENIKRFYSITHNDTSFIRAWQGHKLETKNFYATKGSFLINWIKIDDWKNPSKNSNIEHTILSDKQSEILTIKPGYVTGFKALETDSTLVIFSDMSLDESKNDDYRYPANYWQLKHV